MTTSYQFYGTYVGCSNFTLSLLLHVSHLQVSVMMTLSKMVLPFTCHRSKPMNPKSSYLYLGFLLNWQSIFNTKRCAMVNTREHVIVELLVEAVLLANDKLSHTNTSASTCCNSNLSISLLNIWDFITSLIWNEPEWTRTLTHFEAFRGQWSMVSISSWILTRCKLSSSTNSGFAIFLASHVPL